MEKMTLGLIITFFIGVIVAASLLSPIAKPIQEMTQTTAVTGEPHAVVYDSGSGTFVNISYPINVTYYPTTWRQDSCPITGFALTLPNGTALAVTTDYVVYPRKGTYTLVQSALVNFTETTGGGNWTNASYSFCSEGYVTNSGGRAMASLIVLFAALALLGYAVWNVVRAGLK